jgi:HEPN domain-containing protein
MADPKIVKEWLKKADEDMNFSSSIIDESTFYAQICFHFHQAAEKYFRDSLSCPILDSWLSV